MGSLQAESEEKQEMDDSGCIQDETPPSKRHPNGVEGVQLLDLSDDVLLLILRYLTPRDLRAVGYTCPRLGELILDRSLWQTVDARGQPWGRARFRWYLARALHAGTRELLISGHARETISNANQPKEEVETKEKEDKDNGREEDNNNQPERRKRDHRFTAQRVIDVPALGPNAQLYIDEQRSNSPDTYSWPRPSDTVSDGTGPEFTLTPASLRQLSDTCPHLTSLALEYCNINCNCTSISMFPPTLKKLSLRGSKCYNLPLDRSFLFKIQDSLPGLESLDVSECEWMEPASLLPLSKLPHLQHLLARDCPRLTEFVAYASLATRYGFTKLHSLDLRGSPVGDSEVSALGWLSTLCHLWLAPAKPPASRDPPACRDEWEDQEPEYYKLKEPDDDSDAPESCSDDNGHTWQAKCNGSSDYGGSLPAVFSSPTMIINAPRRASNPRPRPTNRPSTSNDPTINVSPMQDQNDSNLPGGSSNEKACVRTQGANISMTPHTETSSNSKVKAQKRRTRSPSPGPSKRKRDDSSSSDDDVPLQNLIKPNVNEGASTSKEEMEEEDDEDNEQEEEEAQPRHHVLYVNVGQRLHAVYRLSLDNEHVVSFNRHSNRMDRNIFLSPPGSHLDATSLVTDSAIRRFGRADGEDINYVHIGPNGPYPGAQVPGARPDRSSLMQLSVTGFRTITDRSLDHLATSAPFLRLLDLSETNVTDAGVAAFRSLRPDCRVIYSKYQKKD
ncbi:uncharacterized protein LOC125239231 [Leguminivora glycinivorella]|uniref:uncharacterized protein LOC125239231 n=1 Tax=Leguminivora glycinivorella TaxID=1035111 RepID=UPI00200CB4DC|nr:uncharacterized protein LOC125239231 [Leguminivora glycinivorella]